MAFDWFGLVRPVLHALDAETAHRLTLRVLANGLLPAVRAVADRRLATRVFGVDLPNPLGIAAGFDKRAEAWSALYDLGFGFVEVGGVTPKPQVGNPRPRLFRLPEDQAVINRMGFNNDGLAGIAARLPETRLTGRLLGINLAANGDSGDPMADFLMLAEALASRAGFLTIDISCPNTANGKMFLEPGPLDQLCQTLRAAIPAGSGPALLLKSGPDLEDTRVAEIVGIALAHGIDGMIVCNTTVERPAGLKSAARGEMGGLSGRPLFARSTELLGQVRRLAGPRLTLIGVGGVASGADAYAKIRAGASLVQLYTALVYHGPALIGRILTELSALLERDGYACVADAVGRDIDSASDGAT